MDTETNNIVITLPAKNPDLARRASSFVKIAESYVVDSQPMFECAADDLKNIKALQKRLEEQRTSEVGPLNAKVKEINDEYRDPKTWLENAEAVLKGKILAYSTEQERIAAEERRKSEEAASQERARLEAEARAQQAEALRQAQEAQAAEAAKRQAEADALAAQQAAEAAAQAGNKEAEQAAFAAIEKANRERIEAESAAAQARLNQEQAQAEANATEMTALVVSAPVVQATTKVSGISTSKSWKARITDKAALLRYIAENPDKCADWVDIKMTPLNGLAKALKQNMEIPGVEAYPDSVISARAA